MIVTTTRIVIAAFAVFVAAKCLAAPGRGSVYPEYVQAGRDFWSGEPASFVARQYLPYFSLAASPLALLPPRLGQLAWAMAGLAVYFTGLRLFFRACVLPSLPGLDERRAWGAFLACGMLVGVQSLANEQANVLIAGLLMHGTAAAARQRWAAAAVCLALPMFKLYPLALGLALAALHPRRLLVPLLSCAAVLLLLPFAFLPPADAWERYAWIAAYAQEGRHSSNFVLVGVREFLQQRGVEMSFGQYFLVQALAGGIIPLLALAGRDGSRRTFVLVSLWFVTFGPSVEGPTYLLAAPALGWLLLRSAHGREWLAFGFVLATVLLCGPAQTSVLGVEAQRWLARSRLGCVALLGAYLW
ncbi:MAG: glycosyltransferase 87 family protein, partial [Gemmataceae bacterium]|nr:glycosyltransferase 87 family protein [Gemmataceae bacterium]